MEQKLLACFRVILRGYSFSCAVSWSFLVSMRLGSRFAPPLRYFSSADLFSSERKIKEERNPKRSTDAFCPAKFHVFNEAIVAALEQPPKKSSKKCVIL